MSLSGIVNLGHENIWTAHSKLCKSEFSYMQDFIKWFFGSESVLRIWEAYSSSTSQDVPCIFDTCVVPYHVQKSLPLVCFQRTTLIHGTTLPSCLLKIHFNIIWPIYTSAFRVVCVVTYEFSKWHVLSPLPIWRLEYMCMYLHIFLWFNGYKYIIVCWIFYCSNQCTTYIH